MRALTESELYSAHLHQRYCPSSAMDKVMHIFPCRCLLSSGQKSDQISQEHGVFEMNHSLLAVTKGDINFRTIIKKFVAWHNPSAVDILHQSYLKVYPAFDETNIAFPYIIS